MPKSILLLLLAGSGFAQTTQVLQGRVSVPGAVLDTPDTELEAANKANPDDLRIAGKLLLYLSRENRDASWSSRFAILNWNVQHHPEATFLGSVSSYAGMPEALSAQLKEAWITQVHQHADNPSVLRNASVAMSSPQTRNAPTAIRVGGNVQEANLLSKVEPVYPPLAKQARVQGTVRMSVTIGNDGSVSNIQLISGHPLLAQSAMSAVQQYKYRPTLLNGQPITVMTTADVSFTLNP